jgi:hypothetical protein
MGSYAGGVVRDRIFHLFPETPNAPLCCEAGDGGLGNIREDQRAVDQGPGGSAVPHKFPAGVHIEVRPATHFNVVGAAGIARRGLCACKGDSNSVHGPGVVKSADGTVQ